jgi:hypothetical protein
VSLGTSRGAKPIRRELCPGAGGVVQHTGSSVANDAEGFPLGGRQFIEFALSLIGLRLAVKRAGQLVLGMDWVGGPLALAIIGARRAYELHHAQGEQEEKYTVPDGTTHHRLPPDKSGPTVPWRAPALQIASFSVLASGGSCSETEDIQPSHATGWFHTGGIPSRVRHEGPL